jgi:hypothetical protein
LLGKHRRVIRIGGIGKPVQRGCWRHVWLGELLGADDYAAFLEYRMHATVFSATEFGVIRRLLAGEGIDPVKAGCPPSTSLQM